MVCKWEGQGKMGRISGGLLALAFDRQVYFKSP